MNYKNVKKLIAAAVSSGMLLGAVAVTGEYEKNVTLAEEAKETENRASLAIAGEEEKAEDAEETKTTEAAEDAAADDAADDAEKTDAEEATETEEAVVEAKDNEDAADADFTQLETTGTTTEGIVAMDVSGVVEQAMPSIVAITTKSVAEVQSFYYGTQQEEQEGAGSGVIISQNNDEILVATNNHVVEDTTELTVCFTVDSEDPEDLVVPGVVKGTNSKYDLAVVAVKKADIPEEVYKQLRIATLGHSDNLKVGEGAIVIGNALGSGQTVTTGIISALEREVVTDAGTFTEFQTDAAVNLGCSGGAILNAKGQVIGITSAKATGDYAESMGYGIPIDTAIPVLETLINRETREEVEDHGFMGITVVPVSEEAMQMYNMPGGAFVYEVTEGSAGEAAGIKKGDIITKFDGIDVASSDELVSNMKYYNVGETVTVTIMVNEGGSYVEKEVEVTLQAGAPSTDEKSSDVKEDQQDDQNDQQSQDNQFGQEGEGEQDNQSPYNNQSPFGNGYGFGGQGGQGGQGGFDEGDLFNYFFGNGFGY